MNVQFAWPLMLVGTMMGAAMAQTPDIRRSDHTFTPLTVEALAARFARAHEVFETIRNEEGSWGQGYSVLIPERKPDVTHPLMRYPGYAVLGYLAAWQAQGKPIYRQRAIEGLAYLLSAQDQTGAFRWYWTNEGLLGEDALYSTGIAGSALVAGYNALGDKRYLDASARAAKWEASMPLSGNANYNLFAVWHMAAQVRAMHDEAVLDSAAAKAAATLAGQTQEGCWSDDHNQYLSYHSIIVCGLVELLSVLPKDHPQYATIHDGTVRAVSFLISRIHADGSLEGHAKRSGTGLIDGGLAIPALITAKHRLGWDVDQAVAGLVRYADTITTREPNGPYLAGVALWDADQMQGIRTHRPRR